MKLTCWATFLGLLVLNLILAGPSWGKELPAEDPGPITDTGRFQEEYLSAGALKFFENSEDVLRLAQFERALLRFRFLKGQIKGKAEGLSLLPMVDMRLHWLKKQMRLHDWQVAAIPPSKVKKAKIKPTAVKPPPPPPPAKPKNPDEAEDKKAPAVTASPAPPPKTTAAPLPAPPKGEVVTTTDTPKEAAKAKETEKAEEGKEGKEGEETKMPPGLWQKLKIRLHLQKKVDKVDKAEKAEKAEKSD